MDDREVGELWRDFNHKEHHHDIYRKPVLALICKLVEERKFVHMNDPEKSFPSEEVALSCALQEFNIPEEEYSV